MVDIEKIEEYKRQIILTETRHPDVQACLLYAVKGGKNLRTQIALGVLNTEILKSGLNLSEKCNHLLVKACFYPELIHVASLILDDCPHMDNDNNRRGLPSVHMKFGLAMAQLCSFILIEVAHKIISDVVKELYQTEKVLTQEGLIATWLELDKYKSNFLGENGLAGGQLYDLYFLKNVQGKNENLSQYFKMIEFKTCRLFEASFLIPKILISSLSESKDNIELYRKIGYHFGMAFQIADDLMDSEEDHNSNNISNYLNSEEALILAKKHLDVFAQKSREINFDSTMLIKTAKLNFINSMTIH